MKRPTGLRASIAVGIALALVALGLVSFFRRIVATVPVIGVEWVQARSGPVALAVEPGSPGWAAGIEPGDVLLSAGGREVRSALEAMERPWEIGPGGVLRLEVRRGDKTFDAQVRPERRRAATETYAYLALVALAFLGSASLIAVRWPTVRGGTVYGWLGACLYASLMLSHTGRADAIDWTIYWIDVAAGAAAPALLLQLVFAVTRRTFPAKRLGLGAAWAGTSALVAFPVWLVALGGAQRFRDPVLVVEAIDRMQLIYLALSVVLGASLLVRSCQRTASGLHHSQMRWMLWGLGVGLLPFVVVYAVPWALGERVPPWAQFVSVLPMLLVPASFTAALVRYRLHDLHLLLRRGLSEVAAIFCILAIYAIAKVAVRASVAGLIPLSDSAPRYVAILLAAVAYPKVREWIRGWVDQAFYRKRYSYRATLLEWGRELNAETDLPSILDRLEERVRETLGIPEAQVLVRTGERTFEGMGSRSSGARVELDPALLERLDQERHVALDEDALPDAPHARYLFGMRVKGSLRAILVAAERDGPEDPLSSEDRALLSTLSAHAASAIETARLVREVRLQAGQLERLKARQERILESSVVGLLLADGERKVLAWNRALEEIYGLPRERAIGRPIEAIFPLHLIRRIDRELETAPPRTEVRIYGYTLVNGAGRRIVVNLSVSPASHESNGDGARVISFDDVTERVKLEEQVLRQERLASLGLLAAGVAHEVNTPLTGISSYTQMLLEEIDADDPRREILEKIEAQSRRASSIANSLLNIARPDQAAFEELSVNETIGEVLRLFEPQVKGKGIRIDVVLEPHLPLVRGHHGKIQQVLLNLLLNARDAVEPGGRIAITTASRGDRILVEVLDDGVGIAEEDLPRIFDPFFTTKGRGKGTGLGLSITYGIVQEHEGEMQVESSPGETRFVVDLPVLRAQAVVGGS